MKTLIWKELRENARWGALAFFCLLLAEIFALSSARERMDDSSGITLCNSTFLLVSLFGCAAIGAALGALQILPELRRDQWASLLHRPVPRHVIFLGKAAAGLLLYAVATGLPLLISIAWVAMPGQFAAPFVAGLALPAASDLLLGAACYFAALLLALHHGRWLGARGAIALSAIGIFVLHLSGRWPVAVPLGAAVVLGIAAWGAMLGSVNLRPWPSRVALGIVLLAGVQTALSLLAGGIRALPLKSSAEVFPYTEFYIAADGTVLLQRRGPSGSTVTDLQGNAVTDERYADNNSNERQSLSPYNFVSREFFKARGHYLENVRISRRYLELISGEYGGAENWYQVAGAHSHFVGFNKLSARRIGICDADGFKSSNAPLRPFASEPRNSFLATSPFVLSVGPQVLAIDFSERRMTTLLTAEHGPIYGAMRFPYPSERPRIAVALESEIRILDAEGAPLFTLPYGHKPERWPNLGITATEDFSRTFLQYAPSWSVLEKDLNALIHLDVIDEKGERIATHAARQTNVRIIPPTWRSRLADLAKMPGPSLIAILLPAIQTLDNLRAVLPVFYVSKDAGLAAMLGSAIALSGLTIFWARRVGLSRNRTAVWVTATLLFGAAGFFAYRLATAWPARVRCPSCDGRRSVSANTCPRCQNAWELTPANGTEIFEPA